MSRKNDDGDPMPIRLQTSHRLISLPSLINANYWPYRGRRWHRLENRSSRNASRQSEPWDASWDHCHLEIQSKYVSGSPWLQEQLRSRCRELINIFSTSVRSLCDCSTYSVRTACHFARSHLTQTSFTTHSVQYTQYTLSVHLHSCSYLLPSLCVDASLL